MRYETISDIVSDSAANAFTLLYSGTNAQSGTCTVALAADTITVARTNVNGLTFGIKCTATTATAAIGNDTLTLARAGVSGMVVTYTGDLVATIAVDTSANTLTLTIDGTPTVHDLTAAAKNTLTEMVAILEAVDGVTCTLATGADGAAPSEKLDTLTEFTLVKNKPKTLTYTPADITYDLTAEANNTLGKVQALVNALPEISCTLATGALSTQDSATLNDKTATSIKTGYTWLYSPADVTWDTTQAANNTVDKLIALFNATTYLVATKSSGCHGGTDSQLLVPFSAQNIASTAYQITYISGAFEETSFMNIGYPIPVYGWDSATFFITVDINDSLNVNLRFLAMPSATGTAHYINHDDILYTHATVSATKDCIELDVDADQNITVVIPNLYGIQYIQLQAMADTVGATPGQIDNVDVILSKRD